MELAANLALLISWLSVTSFILLHLCTRWTSTRFGVHTMITSVAFEVLLTWVNLRPWFGINVLEHPNLRAGFWIVMAIFFLDRTYLLVSAQRTGKVFEEMQVRGAADPRKVARPSISRED